jgi:hypothetical protein
MKDELPDLHQTLARRQFDTLAEIGGCIGMTDDDQRRLLAMSLPEWSAWQAFCHHSGPPPDQPPTPTLLLRLAKATYRLAVRAERAAQGSTRAVAVPDITSLPS